MQFVAGSGMRSDGLDYARQWRAGVCVWMLVCLAMLLPVAGCGGCQSEVAKQETQAEKDKKKKEEEQKKPKPPFEATRLNVLPGGKESRQFGVKPGHWMSVSQRVVANNYNFSGQLVSAAVGNDGHPLQLERAPYRLTMVRPASLVKGQPKQLEFSYFVPRSLDRESPSVRLHSQLLDKRGNEVYNSAEMVRRIAAHQYYFLVLARKPDAYKYLDLLDSIRPPGKDTRERFYFVVSPDTNDGIPLPGNPLAWTTIAHILWDDVDPALLRPDQQKALIDWLHMGGQLTISGPASLPVLKGSFLSAYLPATMTEAVNLEQADFAALNQRLSLPVSVKNASSGQLTLVTDRPISGVQLKLTSGSQFVPATGHLLAERRIGRGRLLVTAFPLTSRTVINWRNFDGFFNSCVLRNPGRRYFHGDFVGPVVAWRDKSLSIDPPDPRLITNLRMFSRDMAFVATPDRKKTKREPSPAGSGSPVYDANGNFIGFEDSPDEESAREFQSNQQPINVDDDPQTTWKTNDSPLFDDGYEPTPVSGIGGWNDFSGVADACRRSLREAAGISIPKADFVFKMLSAYLLVLVPINWLFFRLLGRVEWAWIAAPVIAVIGTLTVVKMAQLDIGFASSRTEVAVLELHDGHPRGHLTRFTALYSSFSTSYDLFFDDDTALAEPFAVDPNFQYRIGQVTSEAIFRRDKQSSLRDFQVRSNSTGMVHSEQMLDLEGPFRLIEPTNGPWRLINDSNLTLRDVGVLRRTGDRVGSSFQVAWVGVLESGGEALLKFGPPEDNATLLTGWEQASATSSRYTPGEVNLRRVLNLARDPRRLGTGEIRMIGWTDRPLEGMTVSPAASQSVERTLVVGQLRFPLWGEPQVDANTRRFIEEENRTGTDDDKNPDQLNLFDDEPE